MKSYCNEEIHNKLQKELIICPFCFKRISEINAVKYFCYDNMDIVKDSNGGNICKNCGIVHFYDSASEYKDFYQNKYRITKK